MTKESEEGSGRGKKRNQKMKPFLVYQYLLRHTDENHTITGEDICSAMTDIYDIEAERRGIYRDIDEINKALIAFEEGISIEEAAEWIEDDESLKKIIFDKHQKGFCLRQRHYDYTDIQLLVESIYASKYLSESQAERLIKVLCEFVSEFQEKKIRHNAILTDRVKTNNSGVLNNIEKIDAAMSKEDKHVPEKISFKYLKYSISNLNQQVERRHGSRYEVSPYALLINDGNYYLLAYNDYVKDLRTYRVDRMKDVKLLGVEREGKEIFNKINLKNYTQRVFSMFGGEQERITIQFINPLLDTVVDRFGKKGMLYNVVDDRHFSITAPIEISDQFYGWVLGFGNKAKILKPQKVVDGFTAYLDKVKKLYES
nr:WYL domain-containing protein [uncultured Blautia sp.]